MKRIALILLAFLFLSPLSAMAEGYNYGDFPAFNMPSGVIGVYDMHPRGKATNTAGTIWYDQNKRSISNSIDITLSGVTPHEHYIEFDWAGYGYQEVLDDETGTSFIYASNTSSYGFLYTDLSFANLLNKKVILTDGSGNKAWAYTDSVGSGVTTSAKSGALVQGELYKDDTSGQYFYADNIFEITKDADADVDITLTLSLPANKNVLISWGDGQCSTVTGPQVSTNYNHTYGDTNEYPINIIGDLDSITKFVCSGEPVSGDLASYLPLLTALTYLNIYSNSFEGNLSSWELPASLVYFYISSNSFTGNLSSWELPASLVYFYISSNSFTGDLSSWELPASLVNFYIYSNSFTGDPDISNNTAIQNYQCQNNGLSESDVDAILLGIYNRRASFTYATPELNIAGDNAAPSGVYQDGDPPTTGKEYWYEIVNDPESEGFNTWTVTANS